MRGGPQTGDLDGLGPIGLSLLMGGSKAAHLSAARPRPGLVGHRALGKAGPGAARSPVLAQPARERSLLVCLGTLG